MSNLGIPEILEQLEGKDVFISPDPEVLDFTNTNKPARMVMQGGGIKAAIPLSDFEDVERISAALPVYLAGSLVISWGLKTLNSYIRGRIGHPIRWDKVIYDLKVIEHYLGIHKAKPESFIEARNRLREVVQNPSWKLLEPFYRQIYAPLVNDVIPAMETQCLIHRKRQQCVYAAYEIEGQANGRLKCTNAFKSGFMPHSMTPEEKSFLVPPEHEESFFYFDYNHMEVSVLAWLSKDRELMKILDSGGDLYELIWKRMTTIDPTPKHRELCKSIFLPVIYGQGVYSLSKRLEVGEKTAESLINRLNKAFPDAVRWVNAQVTDAQNVATDVWGRRREFDLNELYKIRNFCIQSPASMVCLTKLVRIYQKLNQEPDEEGKKPDLGRIAFHLHDGYCILLNYKNWNSAYKEIKSELEAEDELFPGLRLRVSCQTGQNLNNLVEIGA